MKTPIHPTRLVLEENGDFHKSPKGMLFMDPLNGQFTDLSGVRILRCGVDTVRQLYNGKLRPEVMALFDPGAFMTTGGVARRLIDFANACVGHIRGGLAIAAVLACMLFAALSGSSPATVAAVGSIAVAGMVRSGYPRAFGAGIICNAGTLGILIPPSIVMVVYAAATETSICMARKPLIGTVARNVLAHGTGALNIDGCRIPSEPIPPNTGAGGLPRRREDEQRGAGAVSQPHAGGRWPANLIHDGSEEVVTLFPADAGQAAPLATPAVTWPIGLPLPSVRITVAPASAVPAITLPLLGSITGAAGASESTVALVGLLLLPAASWASALITVPLANGVAGVKAQLPLPSAVTWPIGLPLPSRPLLLGLWFMTADLVCSWVTLYRRLLLELLRLLKPVLLWVLRVLLVRLVLMLLMMYLGTQAFRALLL